MRGDETSSGVLPINFDAGQVVNVGVFRYRRPSPRALQPERTVSNAVVCIRGVGANGATICGYGEVQIRKRRSGGGIGATWRFLQDVLAGFESFATTPSSIDAARDSLVKLSARLVQLADKASERELVELTASEGSVTPFGSARFAMETAFADFAGKSLGIGLGSLLSGQSHQVAIVPPIRGHGANGTVRRDEVERALQLLPPNSELAIDLERSLSFERACASLENLIKLANSLEVAHPIVIHRPLRAKDADRWRELQEHVTEKSLETELKPVIRIAHDLTGQPAPAGSSASHVTLMPTASGGLLAAFEQMRTLAATGVEHISLVDSDASDSVGHASLKALGSATLGTTVLLCPSSGDGGHPAKLGHGGAPDWRRILEGHRQSLAAGSEATNAGLAPTTVKEANELRPLGARGISSVLLQAEALRRGLRTRRTSRSTFTVGQGDEKVSFTRNGTPRYGTEQPRESSVDETLIRALADQGITVSEGPVARGSIRVEDTDARSTGYVARTRFRVLALRTKILSVLKRDPLTVVGDGTQTVAELLLNGPLAEQRKEHHPWAAIDERVARTAGRRGIDLDSIPAVAEEVVLAPSLSLSRGATTREFLSEFPEGTQRSIESALDAVKNDGVIALDLQIETDPRDPANREVRLVSTDHAPLIAQFAYPLHGPAQDVVSPIAQTYFSIAATEDVGPLPAVRIVVRGRVTQVGYRVWTQRLAQSLSLTGWARNAASDKVEIIAAGAPLELAILAARAVQGPSKARVESVVTTGIEDPDVPDFRIVRKRPKKITILGSEEAE